MTQRSNPGERRPEGRSELSRHREPMDAESDWSRYEGDSSGGYGTGGSALDFRDVVGSRAEERRLSDPRRVFRNNRGRGPRNYRRSDDRIREDINDLLTDDPYIDASDLEVSVVDGEVTLSGTISSRVLKRRAEDLAAGIPGVTDVQNNLRLQARASVLMGAGRTTDNAGGDSGTGGNTPTVF